MADIDIDVTSPTISVMVSGVIASSTLINMSSTNYAGSACNGSDGDTNRVLNAAGSVILLFVDNQFYHPTWNYTTTGSVVTFTGKIWDDQKITAFV